jgi:hypothetical protein
MLLVVLDLVQPVRACGHLVRFKRRREADPGPDKRLRPWWETWTLVGCGRTIDVPMDFIPRDTGGAQIIQPGDAVEIKQN